MRLLDSIGSKEKRLYNKVKKLVDKGKRHSDHKQYTPALESYQKARTLLDQNTETVSSAKREFSTLYDAVGFGLTTLNRESDGMKCLDRALAKAGLVFTARTYIRHFRGTAKCVHS